MHYDVNASPNDVNTTLHDAIAALYGVNITVQRDDVPPAPADHITSIKRLQCDE